MSLLEVNGLNSYYGDSHILFDVALRVERNEVVALLGRNGAGKSTTLKSLMGVVTPRTGSVDARRRRPRRPEEPRHRAGRHAARARGAAHLRQPQRRGEPDPRRPDRAEALAARPHLRDVPAPEGAARQPRHRPVGRRAADAGDRPRAGPRSQDHPARRAVRRAGAGDRARADERLPRPGRGRPDHRAGRAEHLAATLALAQRVYIINNGHIVHEGPAAGDQGAAARSCSAISASDEGFFRQRTYCQRFGTSPFFTSLVSRKPDRSWWRGRRGGPWRR